MIGNRVGVGEGGVGLGLGLCQPSSYLCRRCLAAASTQGPVSTVRAWDVALLSIMSIIRGPIFISAVSLPVAIFASAMGSIFCLRGPVLWPVSSPHRPPSSSSVHAKTAPHSAIVVSSNTSGNFQDLARDFVRCGSAPNLVPPKLSELSGKTVGSKFPIFGSKSGIGMRPGRQKDVTDRQINIK